ncbi:hypothetical protein GCM10022416_42720 [Actinomadura keratinilytica]|uniref:Uncharacterized protein n=1 Tax=Actinomadura keratinilytica TaxID=547461 RepID=A0ABP7Z6I4_9ACTN
MQADPDAATGVPTDAAPGGVPPCRPPPRVTAEAVHIGWVKDAVPIFGHAVGLCDPARLFGCLRGQRLAGCFRAGRVAPGGGGVLPSGVEAPDGGV